MDILIIISHLGPGGSQKVAVKLANGWNERGYKVGFLTTSDEIEDTQLLNEDITRIKTRTIGLKTSLFKIAAIYNFIKTCIDIRKAILKHRPGIIISFICPTNIKVIIASIGIRSTRLIISERNNVELQRFPAYIEIARKLLYKSADVVTANSKAALKAMSDYVPEDKLQYLPNPVDMPDIEIKEENPGKNELKLLYVGRLVKQKRIEIILKALNKLLKQGYNFSLTIAGDGPLISEIRNYCVNNNIENNVNIVGHVDDIDKYYMESNIFILCSDYEGTSNALLEAMSYGLTCIISRNANISSHIIDDRDNGIVLHNNNETELENILIDLYKDRSQLYKYGVAARECCIKYSSESVFDTWNSLLEPISKLPEQDHDSG